MKFIAGNNRHQIALFPISLEDAIEQNNEVRLIDLFVDSLDLGKFGFKADFVENGRPAYHPADLLKLLRPRMLSCSKIEHGLLHLCCQ